MGMYCDQCQESVKGTGCIARGVCGKSEATAKLQDTLVYTLQGITLCAEASRQPLAPEHGRLISEALFVTVTNTNFDDEAIAARIREMLALRDELKASLETLPVHDSVSWSGETKDDFIRKAETSGIEALSEHEDLRSLKSLVLYGLKGIAAYTDHAAVLGYTDDAIHQFYVTALAALTKDLDADALFRLTMETGNIAVKAMALLDKANTETYGNPEITNVNIGVGNRPGILISGHDLKDMEELLRQTEGTGVDVYTHCEMLPAHYYPAFKKYSHFIGNYGSSWWAQDKEFESFNGPILMTTNCIVPVRESYRNRIFTTGNAGYEGVKHIPAPAAGEAKDFSELIELAKTCPAPVEIETGEIVGGFAYHQVTALADKVVDAVKSGDISRFVVMAGCDGRHNTRKYYTEVASKLPQDTVILTAGCAKYRYNKLQLGDIGGIPRVLDAGQCNDSYSLAVIAMKLKEMFGLDDINALPISYDIAWYEQKAVTVFLALLALGVKGIRLGPTLPEFLTPTIAATLVEKFDIKPIDTVEGDIEAMMAGA
ncbi:hydroxylamine reductase [Prosthecochloris sp. N3]|uniref:Hydroxylamine reductase n=1 Tax=Prosthecochloris ethylica TaxID=2743976 RepID=A0ABR9XQ45_9CHLB|nr:hydroxylamine reductase [Prosthecochloris ethylica]MBF0587139.1 hydroxylamine reductase [Prosthecochloris ethylica]MBF0636007.1 hydroxylamine reductase [Prosthecochloris ethylica]NUK48363.1 hydroxylamine reductase [Prosthecochloris ethylica]